MNRRHASVVVGIALLVRTAVVVWAASRFPAAADGFFYDAFAKRLSLGAGYTWLWPDGVVTPAAHYPVGYPAMLAPFYVLFGAHPWVAMMFNSLLGVLGVFALFLVLVRVTSERRALVGGILFAVHPAIVPYTAGVMTEGATLSLLCIALACAVLPRRLRTRVVGTGLVIGVATLVRPQCLLLAPVFGWIAADGQTVLRRLALGAIVSMLTIGVCLPWTARNCAQMDRCALVSVNGGWNLLIGTQTTTGSWTELAVPEECKTVWSESKKDECFERAGRREISERPLAWIARAPKKLFVTFDYFGAAPWYLHSSNASAFSDRAKLNLGILETIFCRVVLLAALFVASRREGTHSRVRFALGILGVLFALTEHGSVAYLVLAFTLLLGRRGALEIVTSAVILETAVLHAAFFGGGRYGLVVAPFVLAVAVLAPKSAAREYTVPSGALEPTHPV